MTETMLLSSCHFSHHCHFALARHTLNRLKKHYHHGLIVDRTGDFDPIAGVHGSTAMCREELFYNTDVNTNVAGLITDCTGDFGTFAGVPDSAPMGGGCNLVSSSGDVTNGQGNFHRERPIRSKRWLGNFHRERPIRSKRWLRARREAWTVDAFGKSRV